LPGKKQKEEFQKIPAKKLVNQPPMGNTQSGGGFKDEELLLHVKQVSS
jgi:hypothetical protein